MVMFSTQPTDLAGNPISSVLVGEEYKVRVTVQDISQNPPGLGVFSAASTLTFNDGLSSLVLPQTVEIGSHFNLSSTGSFDSDSVTIFAASRRFPPPGNAPQFFFSVRLLATAPGLQALMPTFYQPPNGEGTYLYGVDPPLPLQENMVFIGSPLQIVPEPGAWVSMLAAVTALVTVGVRKRVRG